jgi:hypothetical protein
MMPYLAQGACMALEDAAGVERLVRNSLWVGRTPETFYDAVEWLCVEPRALPRYSRAVTASGSAGPLAGLRRDTRRAAFKPPRYDIAGEV